MSRFLKIIIGVLVIGAIFYFVVSIGLQNDPRNVAPPTRAPYTITGDNGTINIPSTMHIEAFDPATNSNIDQINVWQNAGSGQRFVCSLVDEDEIYVDNSTEAENRLWVHITAGDCSGWLLTEFVTR